MSYWNCDICGRFHDHGPGSAWKMVYSGYPPTPDREISRCRDCVKRIGSFQPQYGIRPEASCGLVQGTKE